MTVPGLVDYHLHTSTSIDGHATVEEYCARAHKLGLDEIAITNHMNLRTPDYYLTPETMAEVEQEIGQCRLKYPTLKIRLGIEVDYFDDLKERIAGALPAYRTATAADLDFVMGSVHVLRGVRFASTEHAHKLLAGADPVPIYREYFRLMTRAVRAGLFDVMAHPDLIKRFSGQHAPFVPYDVYRREAALLIEALVACDVGIEINVKGLEHPVGEIYPSAELLSEYVGAARAAEKDPIVILGTDAHRPEKLGANLEAGVELLRHVGLEEVAVFDQGRRIPYSLRDART